MQKRWCEDDVHGLLGLAANNIEDMLKHEDPWTRLKASTEVFSTPFVMAVGNAQRERDAFPSALPETDGMTKKVADLLAACRCNLSNWEKRIDGAVDDKEKEACVMEARCTRAIIQELESLLK